MTASPDRRWFGTDGIRAPFGEAPLDETTVRALGLALGKQLTDRANGSEPTVVLGGDTRASTPTLCRWLTDGLAAHGVDVRFVGVLPTPGIAWSARRLGAGAGIAVSASHNPPTDNGIKLIDRNGFKWPIAEEAALEVAMVRLLDGDAETDDAKRDKIRGRSTLRPYGHADRDRRGVACYALPPPTPGDASLPDIDNDAVAAYLDSLVASLPGEAPLAGLHLAIDTANGAASALAAPLFRRLGARVSVVADQPDGDNINHDCGSTHPEQIAALTLSAGADMGLAFDGDADRVILIDEQGEIRDGDAILYLWGCDLAKHGRLIGQTVVATSMSNLGLEEALLKADIRLVRTDVGDRAVVERLVADGLVLGGEQSGHIVNLDLATTGDGMLTAIHLAALRTRADRPLSALLKGFQRFPQLIENVRVAAKPDLDSLPLVKAARRQVETALGAEGRLVLRYSGTEPLARIMIEGRDQGRIQALARQLADAIQTSIGAGNAGLDGRSRE